MTSDDRIGRAEAARRLGVTTRTIDRYVAAGHLTPKRNPVTGRTTFDADEVSRLRATREQGR